MGRVPNGHLCSVNSLIDVQFWDERRSIVVWRAIKGVPFGENIPIPDSGLAFPASRCQTSGNGLNPTNGGRQAALWISSGQILSAFWFITVGVRVFCV
jgi:hypothetical protein